MGYLFRNVIKAALLLAAVAAPAAAVEQKPLPSFQVVSPAGALVGSAQLTPQARWLLLYVAPDCQSCDKLLRSLKEWQTPQLVSRSAIVVRGSLADVTAYVAAHLPSEVEGLRWYADVNGAAWQALALTGTPVLVGIEGGEIKWMVSGVLNDPRSLEPVVRSWVEY